MIVFFFAPHRQQDTCAARNGSAQHEKIYFVCKVYIYTYTRETSATRRVKKCTHTPYRQFLNTSLVFDGRGQGAKKVRVDDRMSGLLEKRHAYSSAALCDQNLNRCRTGVYFTACYTRSRKSTQQHTRVKHKIISMYVIESTIEGQLLALKAFNRDHGRKHYDVQIRPPHVRRTNNRLRSLRRTTLTKLLNPNRNSQQHNKC